MRSRIYLQITVLLAFFGVCLFFGKMYRFSWGEISILKNGATWNDLWYYNLECMSNACIFGSVSCFSTWVLSNHPISELCYIVKYFFIYIACSASTRAIFHIITYSEIGWIEFFIDVLFLIYVIYRAIIWKNHEPNSSRDIIRDN